MHPNHFSQRNAANAAVAPRRTADQLARRILAPTLIAFGLSLTIAWVGFLGYKLASIVVSPLLFSIIG